VHILYTEVHILFIGLHMYETWPIYICDMTRPYIRHNRGRHIKQIWGDIFDIFKRQLYSHLSSIVSHIWMSLKSQYMRHNTGHFWHSQKAALLSFCLLLNFLCEIASKLTFDEFRQRGGGTAAVSGAQGGDGRARAAACCRQVAGERRPACRCCW